MLEMNFKKTKIKKKKVDLYTQKDQNGTEMNVYLVDGKTFDTLVVAMTTQQKFNQIIDGSPLRYQQTFILRLHIRKYSYRNQSFLRKCVFIKITFGMRTLS